MYSSFKEDSDKKQSDPFLNAAKKIKSLYGDLFANSPLSQAHQYNLAEIGCQLNSTHTIRLYSKQKKFFVRAPLALASFHLKYFMKQWRHKPPPFTTQLYGEPNSKPQPAILPFPNLPFIFLDYQQSPVTYSRPRSGNQESKNPPQPPTPPTTMSSGPSAMIASTPTNSHYLLKEVRESILKSITPLQLSIAKEDPDLNSLSIKLCPSSIMDPRGALLILTLKMTLRYFVPRH
jgi:hypothetical protein